MEPGLTFVLKANVELGPVQLIGRTSKGLRRIIPIVGGTFAGPDLRGTVLNFGADWQLIYDNGYMELDARYTLRTDGGALIYVSNLGFRHGPAEAAARFARGEAVDMSLFRAGGKATFETGAPDFAWMNYRTFIAKTSRAPSSIALDFYAVSELPA
jgi:hypothetical protein